MQERTIILVGYGNMGRALCSGWVRAGAMKAKHIYVIEPKSDLLSKARQDGLQGFNQLEELPRDIFPHYVFFAIKPQIFAQVIPSYTIFSKHTTFISILAGIKMTKFTEIFGEKTAIISVMPNIPAAIGEGMLAFCDNGHVEAHTLHFAEMLLKANGEVARVKENQMDAVTALSGSGSAYVFYLIECLAKAGEEVGLEPDIALLLARQTFKGAGLLASLGDVSPADLRKQVTSPGGTTEAGLEILMQKEGLEKTITHCVKAAYTRSIALGN